MLILLVLAHVHGQSIFRTGGPFREAGSNSEFQHYIELYGTRQGLRLKLHKAPFGLQTPCVSKHAKCEWRVPSIRGKLAGRISRSSS
ncbi:hypothetical protein VTP01DRAFT_2303 [Rhizomucor pusillus]|uniref:uncharacterized protein n=1 Tax=Rhizomucor pusillus TaxID=4840 RepID=UPI003743F019